MRNGVPECECDRSERGGYMGHDCATLWIAPVPVPPAAAFSEGVEWWITVVALILSIALNAGLLCRGYGQTMTSKLETRGRNGSLHGGYGQIARGIEEFVELEEQHRFNERRSEEEFEEPEPFVIPPFILEAEGDTSPFVLETEEETMLSEL